MIRYQKRIDRVAENLKIDKQCVTDVIESIENFTKDGMASMTMFALKIPGIGTFKLKGAYNEKATMINEFDRLFITDKQLKAYEHKRKRIDEQRVDIEKSNNESSSTGN